MSTFTHFAHDIIPGDEGDFPLVDRFDTSLNFCRPYLIHTLVRFRVQAVDQGRGDFGTLGLWQSQGRLQNMLRLSIHARYCPSGPTKTQPKTIPLLSPAGPRGWQQAVRISHLCPEIPACQTTRVASSRPFTPGCTLSTDRRGHRVMEFGGRESFLCCRLLHRSLEVDARSPPGAGCRTVFDTSEREHQWVDNRNVCDTHGSFAISPSIIISTRSFAPAAVPFRTLSVVHQTVPPQTSPTCLTGTKLRHRSAAHSKWPAKKYEAWTTRLVRPL